MPRKSLMRLISINISTNIPQRLQKYRLIVNLSSINQSVILFAPVSPPRESSPMTNDVISH